MGHGIKGSDRTERPWFEFDLAHIGYDECCSGDVPASPDDLLRRCIDSQHRMPAGRAIVRNANARAAAQIESPPAAGRKVPDESVQPSLADSREPEAFQIRICDVVIAFGDKMPGIVDHQRMIASRAPAVELPASLSA